MRTPLETAAYDCYPVNDYAGLLAVSSTLSYRVLDLLAGYRRKAFIAADLIPVVLGAALGQPSVGGIERELSGQHPLVLVRPVVLHLLWTGRLRADLTCPLSADTLVRLPEAAAG